MELASAFAYRLAWSMGLETNPAFGLSLQAVDYLRSPAKANPTGMLREWTAVDRWEFQFELRMLMVMVTETLICLD